MLIKEGGQTLVEELIDQPPSKNVLDLATIIKKNVESFIQKSYINDNA